MATFSIRARAKRSLSRNFWSMIAPLRTLRSLVRKKVSPRAFWPCWNSSTTHSPPSHSIVMPLRKSLGLTIPACDCTPLGVRRTPLPAARLDLAEDRVAQLLGARHRAEQLGALAAGGFELDVPEAPGPAPEPLEGRQVLDPVDGDRSGELGDDPLVEDDPLVGKHVLVGPPAPVIKVDDTQGDEEDAEHQQQAELAGDRKERQEEAPGDQRRGRGGAPVGPGPCQSTGPGGDEGERESDHPAGKHHEIEDVAGLQVEPEYLDQHRDVDGVDEQERLETQLKSEQEEQHRPQRGHQERFSERLPELDLLDSSQPAGKVVQGDAHHGAANRPGEGEEQAAHEPRRPTTARSSAARMAASGGASPVQISKAARPWKSSIDRPLMARAPCSRAPRSNGVTGGW